MTMRRPMWVALLLAAGLWGRVCPAGPLVTHPLCRAPADAPGSHAEVTPLAPADLDAAPSAVSGPVSMEQLGYPRRLPVLEAPGASAGSEGLAALPPTATAPAPDAALVDATRKARPSVRPARSERPWLVDARPARLRVPPPWKFQARSSIPEPASVLLLLTGLLGLATRRRLLRGRP